MSTTNESKKPGTGGHPCIGETRMDGILRLRCPVELLDQVDAAQTHGRGEYVRRAIQAQLKRDALRAAVRS